MGATQVVADAADGVDMELDTAMLRRGERARELEAACSSVASTLWRERGILDRVLFALTVEQLVLRAGEVRWLADADDDVRTSMQELSHCEVLRAIEVGDLAVRLGLGREVTLRELSEAAPEPWSTLLADHRAGLLAVTTQISDAAAENRRLLTESGLGGSWTLGSVR